MKSLARRWARFLTSRDADLDTRWLCANDFIFALVIVFVLLAYSGAFK